MSISKGIFGSTPSFDDRYIPDRDYLLEQIAHWKGMGLRIVLTQGTYDIRHIGHDEYLAKAKSFGDLLIVGVDSDEKVRKRKGKGRPVVPQDERLRSLSHNRSVDVLTIKNVEDKKWALIKAVCPDVLVVSESTKDRKYSDEVLHQLNEFCGEVKVLPPQSTTSTTARLRRFTLEGYQGMAKKLSEKIPLLINEILSESLGEDEDSQ